MSEERKSIWNVCRVVIVGFLVISFLILSGPATISLAASAPKAPTSLSASAGTYTDRVALKCQ